MRTTLDIEKPVLDELKRLQEREKRPLGQLASGLLAEALKANQSRSKASGQTRLKWTSASMGARVDLADKDALYRLLDQP